MKQKRFKTKNSLPLGSLLQLSILIFGLVLAVFLTDQTQKYIGRAGSSPVPKEVKILNVTPTSFAVSWLTDKPANGAIILKGVPTEKIFFDDRLKTYTPNSLFSDHYVTLSNLTPGKTYFFIILSGKERYNNQGRDYQITLPLN